MCIGGRQQQVGGWNSAEEFFECRCGVHSEVKYVNSLGSQCGIFLNRFSVCTVMWSGVIEVELRE